MSEDSSRTAMLTLFRSFGREIRRDEGSIGYLERRLELEYAIGFFGDAHDVNSIVDEGECWRTGLHSVCRHGGKADAQLGEASISGSFFRIANPNILLSCVERRGDRFVVRMYSIAREDQQCAIEFGFGAQKAVLIGLDESAVAEMAIENGAVLLEFGPAEIVTLAIYPGVNNEENK